MKPVAKVALNIAKNSEFDYTVPSGMTVYLGSRVLVSFGNRKAVGIVVAFCDNSSFENLKPILAVLDAHSALTHEHIIFAGKLKERYPYPLAEFLFMMLPGRLHRPVACEVEHSQSFVGTYSRELFRAPAFSQRYQLWRDKAKATLANGQSVVVCFPMVAYLEEALKLVRTDFPDVCVITSQHKDAQLVNLWSKSRKASLIVCTRMGLFFYPLDLGLVVVEDETNHSYFQEEKPFYHLLDAAKILCEYKQVPLILSSDFPSLDTYRGIKTGEVRLSSDISQGVTEVVGLGQYTKGVITSQLLISLLRALFAKGKRAGVIWNKKGYATAVTCSVCGHVYNCERCSSRLKLFNFTDEGICPHCDRRYPLPKVCSVCNKGYLKSMGAGVERVESMLKKNLPQANNQNTAFFTSQIITHLYDGLAADEGFILDADSLLWGSDFRATFDAYIYLKKLSLLFKDVLYVFTRNIDHYLFKSLGKDWREFYEHELEFREQLSLPPAGGVLKLVLRGDNEAALLKGITGIYNNFIANGFEAYGPSPDQPYKLRGNYRLVLTLKGITPDIVRQAAVIAGQTRLTGIKKAIIVY